MSTIAPPEPDPTRTSLSLPSTVRPRRIWTAGATGLLLMGIATTIGAAALLIGSTAVHAIDDDQRQGDHLTTDSADFSTYGYALTVENIDLNGLSGDWLLGEARVRVASVASDDSVFVGIASAEDAAAYLDGVAHSEVVEVDDSSPGYDDRSGGAPTFAPPAVDIWTAQASGTGTQQLDWTPSEGDWTVVVMNRDGSAGVDVTTDIGATLPLLATIQRSLLVLGLLAGSLGTGMIVWAVIRTRPRAASTEVG